ncbi:MAG: hypothetical protein ACXVPD_11100, partial [Bacteroidia bacterium]
MKISSTIFLLLLPLIVFPQQKSGAFIDPDYPKDQPQLLAPGLVSDELGNRDMAISPANDELFYTVQYLNGRGFSAIMHSQKLNGTWTKPEVAVFSGRFSDIEPAFSPDGKTLYFSSNRPLHDSSSLAKDYDIWRVEKQNGQWTAPKNMGAPVNSAADEYYPSLAKSGTIYFTRNMGETDEDIVACTIRNNTYDSARSLPPVINSKGGEFNAFVDPDEQFVIFTGYKRKNNLGAGDLFISFKNERGEWTEAKHLDSPVNGPGLTYCP